MNIQRVVRPIEQEALFNPAFIALVLREAAGDYDRRSEGQAMPVVLVYLVAPLALHRPTREALPTLVTSQMGEWVRRHPELLVDLGERARRVRDMVSVAVCFAMRHGVLVGDGEGRLRAGALRRRPPRMPTTGEVDDCLRRARFLGRWFTDHGDPATTLALWGLRP